MAKIYENGVYREMTEADLLEVFENIETTPTTEERIEALESAIADLSVMLAGGVE